MSKKLATMLTALGILTTHDPVEGVVKILSRYDPENDIIPGMGPHTSWAESELAVAVLMLLLKVEYLEAIYRKLAGDKLVSDAPPPPSAAAEIERRLYTFCRGGA